jgi:hypothetical protein
MRETLQRIPLFGDWEPIVREIQSRSEAPT